MRPRYRRDEQFEVFMSGEDFTLKANILTCENGGQSRRKAAGKQSPDAIHDRTAASGMRVSYARTSFAAPKTRMTIRSRAIINQKARTTPATTTTAAMPAGAAAHGIRQERRATDDHQYGSFGIRTWWVSAPRRIQAVTEDNHEIGGQSRRTGSATKAPEINA